MGNTHTLIASPAYIKENSTILKNVDDNEIVPNIKIAQDIIFSQKLGSKLYERILSDIQNNSLSGDYLILVDDYLLPVILEYTIYYTLPFIHFQIDNMSISLKSGENQEPIDKDSLIYLRGNILDVAQFYLQRLVDYVINNTNSFPEYNQNVPGDVYPSTKAYSSSIYTPKGNGCGSTFPNNFGCDC